MSYKKTIKKTIDKTMQKDHEGKTAKRVSVSIVEEKDHEIKSKSLNLGFKSKKKVYVMTKKIKETIPQVVEENKTQITQELVISSKNKEHKKKAVKTVKQIKKQTHKKQRKGKSLLTAFRINRMTRRTTLFSDNGKRFVLNMNRGQCGGKYT